MLLNILCTEYLPEYYLKSISHIIIPIEMVVRIILVALSTVMMIDIKDRIGKTGFIIYLVGLVIYFTSYFILINYSDTVVGKNIIVQLSGYWTAMIWLIGIGLTGKKLFVKIPYHYTLYIILSVLFGMIHTCHGYILLTN
jgi:hypothetical protein